nr:hypothetical protein [Tanacetum cinerariifolium]
MVVSPNGKMIVDFIENGPYVTRMVATPGEPDLPVPVLVSFHEQTDEELTKNDIKRMDADDQAIQTILLGLPEDVYAAVDSCSDIEEQEKKTKLFNEWEKFTSTDGESIKSYYHRFIDRGIITFGIRASGVNLVKEVAKSDLDSDSSIRLRFVLDCVLSSTAFCSGEDHLLRFAKDKLCQTQNCVTFYLVLRFASEDCVLKNLAFCPKDLAFCSRRILRFA